MTPPDRLTALYAVALRWTLRHKGLTMLVFLATIAATVATYVYIPKGFFPAHDTGFLIGRSTAAADISYEDMRDKHRQIAEILRAEPAVRAFNTAIGRSGSNPSMGNGRLWIALKDRGERDVSVDQFIARIRPKLAAIPGISVQLRASQDINLGISGGAAQYTYVLTSADQGELAVRATRLTDAMSDTAGFQDVRNDLELGARMQSITRPRRSTLRLLVITTSWQITKSSKSDNNDRVNHQIDSEFIEIALVTQALVLSMDGIVISIRSTRLDYTRIG